MDIELFSTVLTLVAGTIFVYAFVLYNKDIVGGKTAPSFVSWLLFSIITGINFFSFLDVTGDWVKTVCAFADFAGCSITLVFLMLRGSRGRRWDIIDKSVLALCALAGASWAVFHSSLSANVIVQSCYFLAFLPTIKNAFREPGSEPAKPWFIWSVAWLMTVGVVLMRWQGSWPDLLNPVSLLFLHFMCGAFALRKPRTLYVYNRDLL